MIKNKGLPKYRLFLDESGDHTTQILDTTGSRYLCLTGIITEINDYVTNFSPDLLTLRLKHCTGQDGKPTILHREDIVRHKQGFSHFSDPTKRDAFNIDFCSFLSTHNYVIISAIIDKKRHKEVYGSHAYDPYNYCFTAVMERYCTFLKQSCAIGDVLAESRGPKENKSLERAYSEIYSSGTYFVHSSEFQSTFSSVSLKFEKSQNDVAGLQIADCLAYPIKEGGLIIRSVIPEPNNFGTEVRNRITDHFYSKGPDKLISGLGIVFLSMQK